MLSALASAALAQEVAGGALPDLNVQTFRPSVDAGRTLWVDDAASRVEGFEARALLQYVDDPLLYRNERDEVTRLLASVLEADVLVAVGAGPARLGVVVPVYLFTASDVAAGEAGLGDLGVDGKLTLLEGARAPVDLALGGRVSFPTATVATSLGSPSVGWDASVIASRELGPVLLAVNLGTRGGPRTDLENIEVDDFLVVRGGGSYAFSGDTGGGLELAWQAPYSASISNTAGWPLEALASGYHYTSRDVVLRAGVGRGVTRGIGSPAARILVGVGYEPRADEVAADTDLDGLADAADGCPGEAEDRDGFEDDDGCPDPDNDRDGVLDATDRCAGVPEDADAWKDEDGCPEPTLVRIAAIDKLTRAPVEPAKVAVTCRETLTAAAAPVEVEVPAGLCTVSISAPGYARAEVDSTVADGPPVELLLEVDRLPEATVTLTHRRIELEESIQFETGRAVLKAESFPTLEEAMRILVEHPEIVLLRIEGHTDERGSAASNQALSEARARAVLDWFVGEGIDPARLQSAGHGEARPLDPAHTEAAWARNRRTDFFVDVWKESP